MNSSRLCGTESMIKGLPLENSHLIAACQTIMPALAFRGGRLFHIIYFASIVPILFMVAAGACRFQGDYVESGFRRPCGLWYGGPGVSRTAHFIRSRPAPRLGGGAPWRDFARKIPGRCRCQGRFRALL